MTGISNHSCVCSSMCVCVWIFVCVDPETVGGWRETQVFCTLTVCRYSLRLIPKCHIVAASIAWRESPAPIQPADGILSTCSLISFLFVSFLSGQSHVRHSGNSLLQSTSIFLVILNFPFVSLWKGKILKGKYSCNGREPMITPPSLKIHELCVCTHIKRWIQSSYKTLQGSKRNPMMRCIKITLLDSSWKS